MPETHIYTHTHFLLHRWADSLPRALKKATVWTFFFWANLCSVWNILKVCELKPGISSLFKVIYLGEVSALNPLKVWRDYNFSCKSTLLAGISSAVQFSALHCSSDSVSVRTGAQQGLITALWAELNRKAPTKHEQTLAAAEQTCKSV